MKPFTIQSLIAGPFKVSMMTGDTGDFIRYKFDEEYPGELCPNILVYVRGRFRRFNEANASDGVDLVPGDTNDKVGYRKKGIWRLESLDDDSLHFCFREATGTIRPLRREVVLEASGQDTLVRGNAALVVFGSIEINGQAFAAGEIAAISSPSAVAVAGTDGATLQVFSLP